MRNSTLLLLSVIVLAFATCCRADLAGFISAHRRDWSFIESVGGMKVKLVGRALQVTCDVSGNHTVTHKPTLMNSAIGVRKLQCSRSGRTLRLTVVTSVIRKGMSSSCGSVDLTKYPAGNYDVVYLNPDGSIQPLGRIKNS